MRYTKTRFDQGYLYSAGIILALTGLGKMPTSVVLTLCMEEPMLGNFQPAGVSNLGLTSLAAGIEFAVLALILFSPMRWLPCLASATWGMLCLAIHLFFFKNGSKHCSCLGWIDAPPITVAAISAWLAVGGGIAFWQAWRNPAEAPKEFGEQKVGIRILRFLSC